MAVIATPCVRLCSIDPVTRLCAGCGRTLREIAQWSNYDQATRTAIMAKLPQRLGAMTPPPDERAR